MSFVVVHDHALWIKHIHGNKSLQERIRAMKEGELIDLRVNGVKGTWERMSLPGVKAMGNASSKWHELRSERRGGIATVEVCD